jgi:hypothetical protein
MPAALQAIRQALALLLPAASVTFSVAALAERNQIAHDISTQLAPGFHVVDVQVFQGTALLTPPTISFKHAFPDDCVLFRTQFEPRSILPKTRRMC